MKSLTRNLFSPLSLLFVLFAFLLAAFLSAHPVFALQGETPGVTFTFEQQFILTAVIGSAIVAVFRLIYEWARKTRFEVPDIYMQWCVVLVSIVVSWIWFPFVLPEWPGLSGEPPAVIQGLLVYASEFITLLLGWFLYAIAAYELIIRHVKDKLGQIVARSVYGAPVGWRDRIVRG